MNVSVLVTIYTSIGTLLELMIIICIYTRIIRFYWTFHFVWFVFGTGIVTKLDHSFH